jgi:DNA-binding CsgD family transcriptional regulator
MADTVFGRDGELRRLSRFVRSLPEGPSACVLEGEAGIGKTALLREGIARAHAASVHVLSCAPAQVEAALSYAALADLFADVEPEIVSALPAQQRDALEIALLRHGAGGRAVGPRAIATATVSLLRLLAAAAPVLVAIDDVQWLDRPSARVLEFAARRVAGHPVGFMLSLRTPADCAVPLGLDRSLEGEKLERLHVSGLSAGALHQLIKAKRGGTFSRAGLLRLHHATAGNPLFALELASWLLRTGMPAAGEPLPVPDEVRDLVAARLRGLPRSTRQALVLAAASPNPSLGVLRRALRASPAEVRARCARAEAEGVVVVAGETLRFAHPLFASAVFAAASLDEQQEAHRRLGQLASNLEEKARHLALASEGADPAVSPVVVDAAREARRRGAPDAAAELAGLAIRLTPADDGDARDRLVLERAYYLAEAGDVAPARAALLEVAGRSGALRSRALLDLAGLDYWGEGSANAVARCEQALAAADGNAGLEAVCHAELAVYCDFDALRSELHARTALDILDGEGEDAEPDTLVDALLGAARASLVRGHGLPHHLVERAYECEARAEASIHRSRVGGQLGQWLKYVDDFTGSRSLLERALAQAGEEGDESSMPNVLMHLAQLECWSGDLRRASRYADESFDLAEQVGHEFGGPPAVRALVDVHCGNVERARATVESRLESVQPIAVPLYLRALGFLELSLGDAAAAEPCLSRAVETAESFGIREPGVYRIHADLIESLIATAQLERAEAVLDAFRQQALASRIPWTLATSARCRGLLHAARGELAAADDSLVDALREHERSPVPFERARTLLTLGLLRRRRNERRLAHDALAGALAVFDGLGAPLWADRARRELRPIGGRPTTGATLTPSEQRVADLAGKGMTNREVAAALFISTKTVEANLARVYRKLEIHSRAELGARTLAG